MLIINDTESYKNRSEGVVRAYRMIYFTLIQVDKHFYPSWAAVFQTAKKSEKKRVKNIEFKALSLWSFKNQMEVR